MNDKKRSKCKTNENKIVKRYDKKIYCNDHNDIEKDRINSKKVKSKSTKEEESRWQKSVNGKGKFNKTRKNQDSRNL